MYCNFITGMAVPAAYSARQFLFAQIDELVRTLSAPVRAPYLEQGDERAHTRTHAHPRTPAYPILIFHEPNEKWLFASLHNVT